MVVDVDSIFPTPADQQRDEVLGGNVHGAGTFYNVGGDFTEGSIFNSTSETEVLDFDIPQYTVTNGIKVTVVVINFLDVENFNDAIFRIKVGTNGSEVEKTRLTIYASSFQETSAQVATFFATVDDLDWTQPQTVSITAENSLTNNSAGSYGEQLLVEGF